MLVLDSSSAIHAWEHYPIRQFPRLWAWLAGIIGRGELRVPVVVMDEIGHKLPECREWLKTCGVQVLAVNDPILLDALRIRRLLEIETYAAGVDENDLFIIALARAHGAELLTNESRQLTPNRKRCNWKIPSVCQLDEVAVPTLDFLAFLKRSGGVFG
ncbi:MAG: DUF4411 family protein [Xanthomonadales bacterium]|jgi:predicted nucleic acid-binding protein|nr:DUF4411 family protein [Xanthomonadales bacterium]